MNKGVLVAALIQYRPEMKVLFVARNPHGRLPDVSTPEMSWQRFGRTSGGPNSISTSPILMCLATDRAFGLLWELYQSDVHREAYFSADNHEAVLVSEYGDAEEVRSHLSGLPLVKTGLIDFDVILLVPFPVSAAVWPEVMTSVFTEPGPGRCAVTETIKNAPIDNGSGGYSRRS